MGQRINDLDEFVKEIICNIRGDRTITSELLNDLLKEIKKNNDLETHKNLGLIASKYVETLQRSNEQLVKVTSMLNKHQNVSEHLDEKDKSEILDLIQGQNK